MSIAEKLLKIAENEEKVHDSGYEKGKSTFGLYETVKGAGRVFAGNVNNTEHLAYVKLSSDSIDDFSGVTLKKCGKNLFNWNAFMSNYSKYSGTTVNSFDENGVTFVGNDTGSYCYLQCNEKIYANGRVTFSYKYYLNGVESTTGRSCFQFFDAKGNNISANSDMPKNLTYLSNTYYLGRYTDALTVTMDIPESVAYFRVRFYANTQPVTVSDIQIERALSASGYEPYWEESFTPDSDGSVEGVLSSAPSMTLFTDAEGVDITCGYYKDAKAEAENLTDLIIDLGGMV